MRRPPASAGTPAGSAAGLARTGDPTRPARPAVPDLLAWPQHEADVGFEYAAA